MTVHNNYSYQKLTWTTHTDKLNLPMKQADTHRRKIQRILYIHEGFYGLADTPTIFQEKIDRTLEYCTPKWLDDKIVVSRRDKQEHEKNLFDVLNKLEKTEYRARKNKPDFFMNKKLARTRNRRKRYKTERRESGNNNEIKTTEKHGRAEVISRCKTIHGKFLITAIGTDRPIETIT